MGTFLTKVEVVESSPAGSVAKQDSLLDSCVHKMPAVETGTEGGNRGSARRRYWLARPGREERVCRAASRRRSSGIVVGVLEIYRTRREEEEKKNGTGPS